MASSDRVSLSLKQLLSWLYALWKFSRPHTIVGTTLSVLGLFVMVLAEEGGTGTWPFSTAFPSVFLTLFACLCGNVYIVGLNQLEDIAIDRINKPHLPLASGEFSRPVAQAIVGITGILALLIAALQGPYLLGMVGMSLAIGTAYSLPPIRLKRFPFWASFCIFTVRGVIVNVGLFLHFRYPLGEGWSFPATLSSLTLFILGFTFAIAILKDIPDIEGDRQYHIQTWTIQLGSRAVFSLARWVLTACYAGMIGVGFVGIAAVNAPFLTLSHFGLMGLLWWRSRRVKLEDRRSIAQFYQFVWKLFFLEYLVFPIACLLR
ncbi:MAG: homogentisate phytyltransferase [Leptolyngbyaceae cyanobacterium bins.59]|nr:homogentisate phytyltransferase [Leptolyngbyaceae cyanobacterium bins.59]